MKIQQEVNALIAEMESLKEFDDEIFIRYFEKEAELQERIVSSAEAEGLTEAEKQACSERLSAAFGVLKGRLSFCTL